MSYEEVSSTTRVGSFTLTAKLVVDENVECPVNADYSNGSLHLFQAHRYTENERLVDQFRDDPLAVPVQLYEHSGRTWSVAGEGTQCQFDTSPLAGYWVCDGYCKENYVTILASDGEAAAREWLMGAARAVLEEYTDWAEGNCWGIVVTARDSGDDEDTEYEASWGLIGRSCAEETLGEVLALAVVHYTDRMVERGQRVTYWLDQYGSSELLTNPERFLGITHSSASPLYRLTSHATPDACLEACNHSGDNCQLIKLVDLDGQAPLGANVPFQLGYTLAKEGCVTASTT